MATVSSAPAAMPQLQSVQKAMALPTVGAAVGQVGAFYTKVKGAHSLLEWALSTAEASVTFAATTAAPYVAAPLAAGDARVAAAIDELERRVPMVTEQPKVIVETTKQAVLSKISPHVNKVYTARTVAEQRVKSLKELSWAKANALLSTAYGQRALASVDTGATYAMRLLDHYLPPTTEEDQSVTCRLVGQLDDRVQRRPETNATDIGSDEATRHLATICAATSLDCDEKHYKQENILKLIGEIVSATTDPALHTVQTVGRLSSVAARRVWANLAVKVNELRKSGVELDVRRYITALLAALHLAKVTSEQQQQQQQQQQPQQQQPAQQQPASPPRAPATPSASAPTTPTTSDKLRSTPEGKSNVNSDANNSQ